MNALAYIFRDIDPTRYRVRHTPPPYSTSPPVPGAMARTVYDGPDLDTARIAAREITREPVDILEQIDGKVVVVGTL